MRIGILTLPFNNNYGGYLQSYALMTVLKRMGHDVELIYRRHNRRPLMLRAKRFVKELIKALVGRRHGSIIPNQEKEYRERGELMMSFVDKYISPKTKPLYSTLELTNVCMGRYDAIVVGSDQVWRPDFVPNIEDFFLGFIRQDTIRRIAYAASFGGRFPLYSKEEKTQCGELLSMFDDVSIREESGVNIMRDFGWLRKKTPEVVLDPTMLLEKICYEAIVNNHIPREKYVCTYVLDESQDAQAMIDVVVSMLNCAERSIIDTKTWKSPNYKMPSIEKWLGEIYNAEFVVTDSFHGTVFSIIFNKSFIVYENKGRGADRFHTLLRHFGLEDRIATGIADVNRVMGQQINWKYVNDKIQEKRIKSLEFISKALK